MADHVLDYVCGWTVQLAACGKATISAAWIRSECLLVGPLLWMRDKRVGSLESFKVRFRLAQERHRHPMNHVSGPGLSRSFDRPY